MWCERVSTKAGKTLYQRSPHDLGRIIEPRYVAMMNAMMRETVRVGTATKGQLPGWQAAGKTGTSQDFRDAWFVGYTAHLVTGVWLGNDDSSPTRRATGGGMPVDIWAASCAARTRAWRSPPCPASRRRRRSRRSCSRPSTARRPPTSAAISGHAATAAAERRPRRLADRHGCSAGAERAPATGAASAAPEHCRGSRRARCAAFSWRNTNPLSSALSGMTRWPPSINSSANAPATKCRSAAGIRSSAGRRNARPSACANSALRHRRRRGRIDRAGQRRRRDDVSDQPHEIVALDPGHPLPAAADRTAKAELERHQVLAQHAALDAEHEADAQPHDANAQALRLPGFALPGVADAMGEAALAAVEFGQRLVLPQAVPADRGAADHHRRLAAKRAISRLTARVVRRRDDKILRRLRRVHSALPIGSPARLITASIRASSGICARPVTSRNGGRSVAALAGSRVEHGDVDGPAPVSASTRRLPMKPVAPVTSTCCRSGSRIDQRTRIA